jgi:hypothetical protein
MGTVALGLVFLNIAEGFSSTGECLYVPDMNSLRIATYTAVSPPTPVAWVSLASLLEL